MKRLLLCVALLCAGAPASAEWAIMDGGKSAKIVGGKMQAKPGEAWNRSSSRPSERGELWTLDGLGLNEVSFFAAVPDGEPIYREYSRKFLPLPRFRSTMALPDIIELFEGSNRILLQSPLFQVEKAEPATLAGHDGVRFRYRFVIGGEEVARKGEAVAAVVDGKLYLVNFAAPAIHYFDRDLPKFQAIVDSITI